MKQKFLFFFLTAFLSLIGRGELWAETYTVTSDGENVNTSSGTSAFKAGDTYQATSNISMYIGSGWTITSGNSYITGNAAPQYSESDWSYKNAGGFPTSGAYLTFTPKANGRFTLNGTKNGKSGNKYLTIMSAVGTYVKDATVTFEGKNISYVSNRVGYSLPSTNTDSYTTDSKTPFTAAFDMTANTTYYILIQTYSAWSFSGFSFVPDVDYTTEIPVSALRYRPGKNGISASNGMDRSVGGFNLLFDYDSYNGIKCNNTNNILFRSQYQSAYTTWNHGKMTIALDANNSNKTISKIELYYDDNGFDDLSKITLSSGSISDDKSNNKIVWTGSGVNSVTFTANYENASNDEKSMQINKINISTSSAPTFSKVTPTIAFSDDESTTLTRKGTFTPTVETTPDNFMWDYTFNANSTGVTYTAPDQNDANPAGTLDAAGVSAKGNATLTATFTGNDFFNNVTSAGVYTLSVTEFQQFTSGEPYEWKFDDASWWETMATDLDVTTTDPAHPGVWYLENSIYKSSDPLTDATLKKNLTDNLPETNNLSFSATKGGRIGFNIGNYVWMNGDDSKIKLPSLPVGTKITARIASHQGTQNPTIDGQSFAVGSGGRDCSVTLTETKQAEIVGGGGVNKVFYIKVEKGEPVLEKVSGSEIFNLNNSTGDDAFTHSLVLRVSKGITVEDITVTVDPASGLFTAAPVKTLVSGSEYNTLSISLTGSTVGTGKVTVSYAGNAGNLGFKAATPVVYDVQVMRQQQAYTWAFDDASYWTAGGTTGDFLTQENSKWTNTTGADYAVTTKVSDIELKANTAVIPATKGLFVTASAGGVHLNIGNYMSLEGGSAASIRIPSLVAGQHVVFKTVADGGECGITTTSSNLRLVSGQPGLNGKDAYYTFHVTSDGDGVFTRTSTAANLQIKYIEVVGATTSCNEMKFINTSTSADVSNTLVSVASGTDTAPFKLSWAGAGTVTYYYTRLSGSVTVTGNSTTDGTVTLSGTGTAKIEASLAENGNYQKSYAVMYVSVKTPVTITLTPSTTSYTATRGNDFGNNSTVTGTATPSRTVYYKSSNEAIARVNDSGVVTNTGEGTVTITAYTIEDDTYLAAEASYTVTYTPNTSLAFNFYPQSGLLNLSTEGEERYIIPHLAYPTGSNANAFDNITFESSDATIATVTKLEGYGTSNNIRAKIIATDDVSKIGKSAVITAIGTAGSVTYYATYTVTITAADECNFAWANSSDIYLYEGDYMEIPAITGNANGNDTGLSKQTGSVCGYYWSLKQSDTKVTSFKYFNKDYRRGEGEPDYTIVESGAEDNNKSAYIIVGQAQGTSRIQEHPNTLLIYGRKEGTVQIHAQDSQNGTSCPDITLHIMPKSIIYGSDGELTAEQESVSYPYTWDFTRDFTAEEKAALDANSYYWTKNEAGTTYYNALGLQNSDFCDDNLDGNNAGGQRLYKALLADHHTMPVFKGMKVQLQGTYYDSKYGRLQLKPNAGNGHAHLAVIGGPQIFELPRPGTDKTEPTAYRVYFKIKSETANHGQYSISVNGTRTDEVNFENTPQNASGVYYKDVTAGQSVSLGFQDVDVYWIAFSTESNSTAKPSANKTLTYAATTYSYGKALDLAKSEEVNNGLTAYYASTFTNGQDAASAVTLRQVTLDQKGVRANTGLVLKSAAPSTNYMIADAENKDSYTAPVALPTNFLVAGDGSDVPSTVGSGENVKTNFVLSWAYKKFEDDGTTAVTDYQYNRDWSFYKVMPSATVPKGKAYLQVDGNLRVKPDGTIETVKSAASRRAADGSNDDRPANKLMLDIVYEDEAHGFDATTAINDVKTDTVTVDDDAWYTIQGVRVNTPARGGIYIHNGRKVVIK